MNESYDKSRALKWQFRLVENSQARMRFVLPRVSLFVVVSICFSVGSLFLLFPHLFTKQPQFLVPIAGWGVVFLGLCLCYFVITRSGDVVIDSPGRCVFVNFRSPKDHIALQIPFSDFISVETRQVKDMHGLHNHWTIELVGQDDVRIKLGATFNGTFRKRVRDELVQQISEMIGIPVDYLE